MQIDGFAQCSSAKDSKPGDGITGLLWPSTE